MKKRVLAVLYGALLLLSHGARRLPGEEPAAVGERHSVLIAEAGERSHGGPARQVRLAYRLWEPAADAATAPVVLLLHGSPGSSRDFDRLGPALAGRFRVVAPDLPGFGRSQKRVGDYSIRAHSVYAARLLDHLQVGEGHVLGFSMGGGVALELTARDPDRVRSLILLSAIGVEEFELLGHQGLNHAVHALQLAGLWLLHEAVPHFGLLDGFALDVPYARNFFDSDQRPLRGALESWHEPTLIVHGERDFLVPIEAAREHHRLLPQSELVTFDSDHFMVFRGEEVLTETIAGFIRRVENGRAATREAAPALRIAAAARPFDPRDLPRASGITLLVVMGLLALATLVSEDMTCIAAGLLVAQGRLGFVAATVGCGLGIFVGDLLLFWAGRRLGRPWLDRRPLRWVLSPARVARSARWFERGGAAVVLLSRFLPGARFPTYFAAGLLPIRLGPLAVYFLVAVLLWTPLLVAVSSWVGVAIYDYFELFRSWALTGFFAVTVTVWLLLFALPRLLTLRGRRRLLGWWRRWSRWEFWPPWLFYFPVFWAVLWLGWRYRSLTLFTAANPAIPAGGFIGESKSEILDRLPAEAVARYRRIGGELSADHKSEAIRAFVAEGSGELPVVLKPDVGQRGRGVRVARTWTEIDAYCAAAKVDLLVQDYVGGREYGVFWLRMPDEETGRVFSITEKLLPEVTGDGRSTLEELVLRDDRAVAVADVYLDSLAEEAARVPAAGERVRLTELGTHCRGAIFLDAGHLSSPPLVAALDRLSRGCAGFCFGRYDLRAPDEESLRQGRRLTVLELNGVTSEAVSIYDPRHGLRDAYRTLFEQWRLAFEVGRRNRLAGAEVESAGALLRRLVRAVRPPESGTSGAATGTVSRSRSG